MVYKGNLLGKAKAKLADYREHNAAVHNMRLKEVYGKSDEIQRMDNALKAQMFELTRLVISKRADMAERIDRLRTENLELQAKRLEAITALGYPSDYLDDIYTCPFCHDSGYTKDGAICGCLRSLYNRELTNELSTLLKNGNESFENFDLTLYSDEYSEYYSCIPRNYMQRAAELCMEFADSFPDVTSGLLLMGGPGLGKTYLSACMARRISENGYSVCYESAVSAFQAFERQQFSRSQEEQETAAEKVRRMLECDLLILDDLGTEIATPAVQSALYTFINTRENSGKHMIISTCCSMDELNARYTASICSRLSGFFQTLRFAGEDIRTVMKRRMLEQQS